MKFARFADEYAKRVAVNPANVRFVREPDNPKGPTYIELVNGRVAVMATFDEVVSGLEGVDAPAVEPDPTDLERAAGIMDALANLADHKHARLDWPTIDRPLGTGDDSDWPDTADALRALAARLRGRAS